MLCNKCKRPLDNDAVFCSHCGERVSGPATADSAHTAQVQPVYPAGGPGYGGQNGGGGRRSPGFLAKGALGCGGLAVLILVLLLIAAFLLPEEQSTDSGLAFDNGGAAASTPLTGTGAGIYGTDITDVAFRDFHTTLYGDGTDRWTLMVYMVGSDLESQSGCATADLQEMLDATTGENVDIVVQTGGASVWHNDVMSDGAVERWHIKDGEMTQLDTLGTQSMLEPESLADFISYAAQAYPANRQALILWDHGGGSVYGYGSDEMFPDDVLYLPDLDEALKAAGETFDFVGFDACLMATMETAYMLEPHADYLVASEELEPGYGWNYTDWVTALSENPSADTVTVGTYIVDSFINHNSDSDTLSVTSLREMPYVYEMLGTYMENAKGTLGANTFRQMSAARAGTRAFAQGQGAFDMVDLSDFVKNTEVPGGEALLAAIDSAVKYRNDCTVSGVHGMSMYFPYESLNVYGYAKDFFGEFGFGGACYDFFDTFVNILAGGQQRSLGVSTLVENMTGNASGSADYSGEAWYDEATAQSEAAGDGVDFAELVIEQQGENYILPLTDADWERLTSIELQVLLDDGEGYIDLGSDQRFETDENDNLLVAFDNLWVAADGQPVSYYAESIVEQTDGTNVFTGTSPALLTRGDMQQEVYVVLQWSSRDEDSGRILGYRPVQGGSGIGGGGTVGRKVYDLQKGDSVQFTCDYFTYGGKYEASYLFGAPLVIGDAMPAVTYEDLGKAPVLVSFMLTDIYQNKSWTQSVEMA